MQALHVGMNVRLLELIGADRDMGLTVGQEFTITRIDRHDTFTGIHTPDGNIAFKVWVGHTTTANGGYDIMMRSDQLEPTAVQVDTGTRTVAVPPGMVFIDEMQGLGLMARIRAKRHNRHA